MTQNTRRAGRSEEGDGERSHLSKRILALPAGPPALGRGWPAAKSRTLCRDTRAQGQPHRAAPHAFPPPTHPSIPGIQMATRLLDGHLQAGCSGARGFQQALPECVRQ